jgi:hypothetical protein
MDAAGHSQLVEPRELAFDDPRDAEWFSETLEEAKSFLLGFAWCERVNRVLVGVLEPGIVCVLQAEIEAEPPADALLWVIVGDVPPAYLVTDATETPAEALEGYIEEMSKWVSAVESGQPIDDVIPVNVPPTTENAAMLKSRLERLRTHILPDHQA